MCGKTSYEGVPLCKPSCSIDNHEIKSDLITVGQRFVPKRQNPIDKFFLVDRIHFLSLF